MVFLSTMIKQRPQIPMSPQTVAFFKASTTTHISVVTAEGYTVSTFLGFNI